MWKDGRDKTFVLTPTGNTLTKGIDDKSRVAGCYINTSDCTSSKFVLKPRF